MHFYFLAVTICLLKSTVHSAMQAQQIEPLQQTPNTHPNIPHSLCLLYNLKQTKFTKIGEFAVTHKSLVLLTI